MNFNFDVRELFNIVLLVTGGLGSLLGFSKLLMEVVLKPYNRYKVQEKQRAEETSHEPMFVEIRRLSEMFESFGSEIGKIEKNQAIHNRTTIMTAKTLLSLITDLSIKGEPNGRTSADVEKLRDYIYRVSEE